MKRKIVLLFVLISLLACLAACQQTAPHCFLCQGIPRSVPCVVNLHTGDVIELSPGGYGNISLSTIGDVSVMGTNGESCTATIPSAGVDVDPDLFCDACMELISQVANTGYILADLRNLTDITLYPIEGDTTFPIGEYIVSVAEGDNESVRISSYKSDN